MVISCENEGKRGEKVRLETLLSYNKIYIQCHDNPDADTIASGYALYRYFSDMGKDAVLFYSGKFQIQKSNLKLMVHELEIPVEYLDSIKVQPEDLLLLVDCQYGEGNVARVEAANVAVIDHHQIEMDVDDMCEIQSELGSCSTLVWHMLENENYLVNEDVRIGTALYYGLFTDTNQFAELYNPLDMDMRESVSVNQSMIRQFRNANISLEELETAGIAMIRNIYNSQYRYAIIKSAPCDPNILGLISDFLLQVDAVDSCVVYNILNDGIKLSVRSCIKEVRANELAEFLCEEIGSGGGHIEKAGGFISKRLYEKKYEGIHTESYFGDRMNDYFENTQIIYAKKDAADVSDMELYQKKELVLGFVRPSLVYPVGTDITVRTLEGDVDIKVTDDVIIMIGIKGEVYPITLDKFQKSYRIVSERSDLKDTSIQMKYVPAIKNRNDNTTCQITAYAGSCVTTDRTKIYAKPLNKTTKIFTAWDEERYMLGKAGDYLAVRLDDVHDIYAVEKNIFALTYEKV